MTFKDQILAEAALFLNANEFGENMVINGHHCLGSWDEENQPSPQFFGATMDVMGVNTVERLLFVLINNDDPLELPVPDQILDIDGQDWTVRDARPESGILKLNIFRNES